MPNMGIYASPPRQSASLANALFSSTTQQVLRILFGQPDRSFYAIEIINLAGSGSGAGQRELATHACATPETHISKDLLSFVADGS